MAAKKTEVLCIIKVPNGNYHILFLDHESWRGLAELDTSADTLQLEVTSYTASMNSLADAQEYMKHILSKFEIPVSNIISDAAIEAENPLCTFKVRNWIKDGAPLKDADLKPVAYV